MQWQDEGVILSLKKYGEYDAVVDVLTQNHGRHAGMVRGGMGRRKRGDVQVGNLVTLEWRGRLETHLGTYNLELQRAYSAALLDSGAKLAVLNSITALLTLCLPEREEHQPLLKSVISFLELLIKEADMSLWGAVLVKWEIGLLQELGFGLDLSCCAATGTTDDLIYVSPKSGRAVSREAGLPYHDKLLALPAFLMEDMQNVTANDILNGLSLTEYFLQRHIFDEHHKKIPAARRMVLDYIY